MISTPTYHLEKVIRTKEDYEDFNGPLDVILHLLSKNKIEIEDVQISVILDQYLSYLDEMKNMDLEIASEFVAMASHLLYIKTRMLLAIDAKEAEEDMALLIRSLEERRRLEEYKKMCAATAYLQSRLHEGRSLFVKPPECIEPDNTYDHAHEGTELKSAILGVFQRTKLRLPPPVSAFRGIVGKEAYSVAAKVSELLQKLIFTKVAKFKEFLRGCKTRSEVVATFLAVLELLKNDRVAVTEEEEADYTLLLTDGDKNGNS
ncbi:segregation/condensation protein A [Oscillospiraceae bacterium OttesenSCG-928-G22]|nr:segregation/condensation protein A [Oscillospiraceae bacterium OttesenSCG-928-G22]